MVGATPRYPGRGSGTSLLVVGMVVAGTMATGFLVKRHDRPLDQPSRYFTVTRTSLTEVRSGADPSELAQLRDQLGRRIPLNGVAMWVKFSVPGGRRNYPPIAFEVRDAGGAPFPFAVAWIRDGAYIWIPKGYHEAPEHVTAILRQGRQVVGRVELPKFPPPTPAPTPHLSKKWPDLSIFRCAGPLRGPVRDGGNISMLINANIAAGDTLSARLRGSSAGAFEPSNDLLYTVKTPSLAGPAILSVNLNYPDTTKKLYLELSEWRGARETRQRAANHIPIMPQVETVRTTLVSVALDHVTPLPAGPYRRAVHDGPGPVVFATMQQTRP